MSYYTHLHYWAGYRGQEPSRKTVESLAIVDKICQPCNLSMRQRSVDVLAKAYGNSATSKRKIEYNALPLVRNKGKVKN